MSLITTHVLDSSRGQPATGVKVQLEFEQESQGWQVLATGVTNQDGRIGDLLPTDAPLLVGIYRLTFDTRTYFQQQNVPTFYPYIPIVFAIQQAEQHYHVPLLLNPFGYTTYRGS
jgi:5-hydroxyisourate hydrolase